VSDSNKKDDDWSFQVEDIEKIKRKEEGPKKVASGTGIRQLIKKNKVKDLKLDHENIPKRISRSNTEEYMNTDQHSKGLKDTSTPDIMRRGKAFAIDMVICLILFLLAKILIDTTYPWLEQFLVRIGQDSILDNSAIESHIDFIVRGFNFVVLYFIVFVPLASFSGKTPGKFVCKIIVEDIDGGYIGFFRTLLRELILKPLCLVSVVGVLILFGNKKRRALHDFLAKSIVRIL